MAIGNSKTFEYQEEEESENYNWFLIMCNMLFFADKLNWGTSIRGAWWDNKEFIISTCGFWDGDEQIDELKFNAKTLCVFFNAMEIFLKGD